MASKIRSSRTSPHNDLAAEYAREILEYDPLTGVFRWRRRADMKADWNTKHSGKIAGSIFGNGYRYIGINYVDYLAHRLAWLYSSGAWPSHNIDHINGNPLDNRLINLREATQAQNTKNSATRKTSLTGVRGVYFCRQTGKWAARINSGGYQIWLGRFSSLEEATFAYAAASEKFHGEFGRPTVRPS